jgi:hypothetical protein
MPNYLTMYDPSDMLQALDLQGREVHLEIETVVAGELTGEKGRKSKKPIVKFKGREKKFAVNKTNGKAIARLYGKNTDDWIGKFITLYPTETEYGDEVRDCIRVRPVAPNIVKKEPVK